MAAFFSCSRGERRSRDQAWTRGWIQMPAVEDLRLAREREQISFMASSTESAGVSPSSVITNPHSWKNLPIPNWLARTSGRSRPSQISSLLKKASKRRSCWAFSPRELKEISQVEKTVSRYF